MKSNNKIWILEDDPGCIFVYQEILAVRYSTRFFSSFHELESEFIKDRYGCDLLIADLRVVDGILLDFFNKKKELFSSQPFMVVSSLDDLDVLRYTYQNGAWDYLIKPFKKAELIVKIERYFYQLEKKKPLISYPQGLDLTSKEEVILKKFFSNPKFYLFREDLEEKMWPETSVHQKTLDVHISNLRKKLHDIDITIINIGNGQWALSKWGEQTEKAES